jgi:hypothetical protein
MSQMLSIKDTNPTSPDLRYLSLYNLFTFTKMQRKITKHMMMYDVKLYSFVLQELEGNNDSTTIVFHPLEPAETARFVRFYPVSYETNACIRVELYGQEMRKGKLVELTN